MKTLVACPEPERRPNAPVTSMSSTTGTNTTGWIRLDVKQ